MPDPETSSSQHNAAIYQRPSRAWVAAPLAAILLALAVLALVIILLAFSHHH
jgi:hypothetical protein